MSFVDELVFAIENEDCGKLCQVASFVNQLIKEENIILSDCFFTQRVVQAYNRVMDECFIGSLYDPFIFIFYTLYSCCHHYLMNVFYEERFLASLWNHVLKTDGESLSYTLKSLFLIAKSSNELSENIVNIAPHEIIDIFLIFQPQQQSEEYYLIFIELLLFLSQRKFDKIGFDEMIQAIWYSFSYYEMNFLSDELLIKSFNAFKNLIEVFPPFLLIKSFQKYDFQKYFLGIFFFSENQFIFYQNLNLLSILYDLKSFEMIDGCLKTIEISFNIQIVHFTKLVNELKLINQFYSSVNDQSESDQNVFVECLLNIFIKFIEHCLKVSFKMSELNNLFCSKKENVINLLVNILLVDFPITQKSIQLISLIFKILTRSNQKKCLKIILENGILQIFVDALESDDLNLIKNVCIFFVEICHIWLIYSDRKYPLPEEIQKYQILEVLQERIPSKHMLNSMYFEMTKDSLENFFIKCNQSS
ncbi:hypothetical protein TRFO_17256 [Tritrichomonas foetus]|uniref:Uncharacterized protein n=1 Tax=Tritrichomonas foetus TaxID=1144522 RepID=A0A1J4KPF2_9EUKA|nr:hypothetical protein TRFO_17256 [Tritrichomonas foetus]|eukprot:OHT12792.1 hypothetical protein TRFO_17256 [Tritrichomonas foetus]